MKKYPVTYKGKDYEVRWTYASVFNLFHNGECISIYEVNKIFKIKTYKKIYTVERTIIEDFIKVSRDDHNYYIEEAKEAFKSMEADKRFKSMKLEERLRKENTVNMQQQALEEWDGVIE